MKWNYLVRKESQFPYSDLNESLDYFGKNEWELVCCKDDKYIFKRPKGVVSDYRD